MNTLIGTPNKTPRSPLHSILLFSALSVPISIAMLFLLIALIVVGVRHYRAAKAHEALVAYNQKRFTFSHIQVSPAMKYVQLISPEGKTVGVFHIKPDAVLITDRDSPTMPLVNGQRKELRVVKFHTTDGKYITWDGTFLITDKIITASDPRTRE